MFAAGDVTSIWIMELLEIYHNTGDQAFLVEMYPIAARAIEWQISVSQQYGLPAHLVRARQIL